jgi:hypothetical protein
VFAFTFVWYPYGAALNSAKLLKSALFGRGLFELKISVFISVSFDLLALANSYAPARFCLGRLCEKLLHIN